MRREWTPEQARRSKRRGRYYERQARKQLEAAGYLVTAAAGSLGLFDLVAIGQSDVRCVQVKGGKYPRLPGKERRALLALQVPPSVRKEFWRFFVGNTSPHIEVMETPAQVRG